ncbi:hypothetical protein MPSEU_000766000 [Mayamaea pseudoterrestris]|nr:hypothetical protein MPSEU_000766000 [Mayamaea pseudoterrestris]
MSEDDLKESMTLDSASIVVTESETPALDYIGVTLIAKFNKQRIELTNLHPTTTILQVKEMLASHTHILPKRQKLVGLVARDGGAKNVTDSLTLESLKSKTAAAATNASISIMTHQFILMGTPEESIFIDPINRNASDMPDVIDDFELDFTAGSDQWLEHVATGEKLAQFTEHTAVHLMNQPRPGKALLVLDLDHTLLDFSSRQIIERGVTPGSMKRPHMDEFLTNAYENYDMVVWSQTSWRWLETKLIELGMLMTNNYKFLFVLDKTSMFTVKSTKRDGTTFVHHVKPLQLIWSKFPQYGSHNTIHIDDLSRNFALNMSSGLKCKAYHRKKSSASRDQELYRLMTYLNLLALMKVNFDRVDHSVWDEVVCGLRTLPYTPPRDDGDGE